MGRKQLEKDIEFDCLTTLVKAGWWPWKNPTVGVYDVARGVYRKPNNVFQISGASDIIAIRDGVVLFVEVKRYGNKQTKEQELFEANIKKNGGHYFVVYSVEELKEVISGFI